MGPNPETVWRVANMSRVAASRNPERGEVPEGAGGGEDLIADAGAFDDGMVGGDVDDGSA